MKLFILQGVRKTYGVFTTPEGAQESARHICDTQGLKDRMSWDSETQAGFEIVGYYGDVPEDQEPVELFRILIIDADRHYRNLPYA